MLNLATTIALETMWDIFCAEALQQTHILPARLMPSLPTHPHPAIKFPKTKRKALQERK